MTYALVPCLSKRMCCSREMQIRAMRSTPTARRESDPARPVFFPDACLDTLGDIFLDKKKDISGI